MSEWRPIATAPKVEGVFLLGYDEVTAQAWGDKQAGLCIISWLEPDEEYDIDEEGEWQVQPFAELLDCVMSETNVTHWQPLPTIPTDA